MIKQNEKSAGHVFGEMVRRAFNGLTPVPVLPRHYCPVCGQTTDHTYAYEQGNLEYYRCGNANCNVLHGYAVR